MRATALVATVLWALASACQSTDWDLNTELMRSTFRIQGPAARGGVSTGTGFLIGRPLKSDPKRVKPVLITAAHVLRDMAGDTLTVFMRQKTPTGWQEIPVPVPIRVGDRGLWMEHARADVAVVYMSLPVGVDIPPLVPTTLLADDKMLMQYEIHPGDELNVLGYPLGFENPGGFPVLRSGKIASYPLVPTTENPYFLMDFRVFRGNSGGPVYFVQTNRLYKGAINVGIIQCIMGLTSEEVSATEQFQGLYENRSQTYPLGLAKIVPAAFIAEAIDRLPPPE